jgi:hypothetical protein
MQGIPGIPGKDLHSSQSASKLLGRVIIPLGNIFCDQSAVGIVGGLAGTKKHFESKDQWYAVYPPAPECRGGASEQKFEAAIANCVDTGMDRPAAANGPLFWVKVGFDLEMATSLWSAHLLHRPFHVPDSGEEEYHNAELQGGIQRITDLLALPHWFRLLQQPKPLAAAQLLWAVVWWGVPLWMYPLVGWAVCLVLGVRARHDSLKTMKKTIRIWNDEIETQSNIAVAKRTDQKSGVFKRIRGTVGSVVIGTVGGVVSNLDTVVHLVSIYKEWMQSIQNALTSTASQCEKILNLLTWADVITSAVAWFVLLLLSLVSSLLLFFVHWQFLGFVLGAVVLCIPVR